MSLEWHRLRTWNGSRPSAFEELCCQLAAYEPPAASGGTFVRKGTPDAGVECFWRLPAGDEYGWQAKFFLPPLGNSQWTQLDESVRTALEKHPRLVRYTICLPLDMSDARTQGRTSLLAKWNQHVEKWGSWAKDRGRTADFVFWGQHQLSERLTRDEHRGRYRFWFDREFLTPSWFRDRTQEAIANCGPRYTPELNVELPISASFDAIGRTPCFADAVRDFYSKVKKAHAHAGTRKGGMYAKSEYEVLGLSVERVLETLRGIFEDTNVQQLDLKGLQSLARIASDHVWRCQEAIRAGAAEQKERAKAGQAHSDATSSPYLDPADVGYELHHLRELTSELHSVEEFALSSRAAVANSAALLLVGNAGVGKTHLLCDVATQRAQAGLPTILLLGGHFSRDEPWVQIIRQLGLECPRDEFLGALEAAAQAGGTRILILVDALNEGEGRELWPKHLAGMLQAIERHPWIGIAVSVRTSYERVVIPEGAAKKLTRQEHHGFAGHEYEACGRFFEHYGIERPSVPLLSPEFQNPLFLKVFCEGLQKSGLTRVPPGVQGLTAVFDMFIDSIDSRLSDLSVLNYDPKERLVRKAVEALVERMVSTGNGRALPRTEARSVVNELLPGRGHDKSLFNSMVSEGLLAEDVLYRGPDTPPQDIIRFCYERFADHMIARRLLDDHLKAHAPDELFKAGQPLGDLTEDESSCWQNRGMIEALSIQLPERTGKELIQLAPQCAENRAGLESFVDSLIWRAPTAFSEATRRLINEHVIRYEDTHLRLLDAILTVACNPQHPYNADFLHRNLLKRELPDRDLSWTIPVHMLWQERTAVNRLVDWAWSPSDKSCIETDSARLCATALSWLLTSSNRYVRDSATKALVRLLESRIPVLVAVLSSFRNVNDPYVSQRLYGVAYGCAMRNSDEKAVAELAQRVYDLVFKDGQPPPDILLRDYARNVIEVALHRGLPIDIDMAKVRPPHHSEWPSHIPTEEELGEDGARLDPGKDIEYARAYLHDSVMGSGDFARYIIGTNSGWSRWSRNRFGEPAPPSPEEVFEAFVAALTPEQTRAFSAYLKSRERRRELLLNRVRERDSKAEAPRVAPADDDESEGDVAACEQEFRKTLGTDSRAVFDAQILPHLDGPRWKADRLDLSIAQRWVFQRVFDLGWRVDRFGRFDRQVQLRDPGRHAAKAERIGKKYQWLAWHEFLARLSDNYQMKEENWGDAIGKFEGAWQLHVRDIDPSCLVRKTCADAWGPPRRAWWSTPSYDKWPAEADTESWLRQRKDLPHVPQLIEVTHPDDGSVWLVMEASPRWEQPTPPGEDRYDVPRAEVWYMLSSYIVKRTDAEAMFEWARRQRFYGRWMPESHETLGVFLGEFFWSAAHRYRKPSVYKNGGWSRGDDDRIPREVLLTVDHYFWEQGYDCSIEDTTSILLPAKWLKEKMGLQWRGVEGQFTDADGRVVAIDPSVQSPGMSALLIRKEPLVKFLDEQGYDLIWTVLGEKRVLGGELRPKQPRGYLELNGAFRLHRNRVEGVLRKAYRSR